MTSARQSKAISPGSRGRAAAAPSPAWPRPGPLRGTPPRSSHASTTSTASASTNCAQARASGGEDRWARRPVIPGVIPGGETLEQARSAHDRLLPGAARPEPDCGASPLRRSHAPPRAVDPPQPGLSEQRSHQPDSRPWPGPGLSFGLIHPRPPLFTGGHPDRVRAVRGRWQTPVNAGQHCWKACWGQPLRSSNLLSSATLTRQYVKSVMGP